MASTGFSWQFSQSNEAQPNKGNRELTRIKIAQRIIKRPTDKTLNGNVIDEKSIECSSVGRFSIRWKHTAFRIFILSLID
jgi:hypothetical protein